MNNIRKLKADEIECRVSQINAKGCSLLLYKTARVDRAILDETFGDLWQNDFKVIDGKMYGGIGIYNTVVNDWLWRWDCGTESNTEAEKGQASDCFKRAGFKWGIGVELYSAPFIWLNIETEKNDKGKFQLKNKFAKFSVKSIDYAENGNIKDLTIIDDTGNIIYSMKNKSLKTEQPVKKDDSKIYIGLAKLKSPDDVRTYYEQQKENVQNRKEFYAMAKNKIEALKNISESGNE